MVLTLVTEHNMVANLGDIICVEHLVHKANQLFLEDQRKVQGDAMLCCAKSADGKEITPSGMLLCGGAAYICQHLYDRFDAHYDRYCYLEIIFRFFLSIVLPVAASEQWCTLQRRSPVLLIVYQSRLTWIVRLVKRPSNLLVLP